MQVYAQDTLEEVLGWYGLKQQQQQQQQLQGAATREDNDRMSASQTVTARSPSEGKQAQCTPTTENCSKFAREEDGEEKNEGPSPSLQTTRDYPTTIGDCVGTVSVSDGDDALAKRDGQTALTPGDAGSSRSSVASRDSVSVRSRDSSIDDSANVDCLLDAEGPMDLTNTSVGMATQAGAMCKSLRTRSALYRLFSCLSSIIFIPLLPLS